VGIVRSTYDELGSVRSAIQRASFQTKRPVSL
jgi:hypothetical protein